MALRLICERENEIEAFRAQEYWSIQAAFTTPSGADFQARLSMLDGSKLDKFGLANEADAKRAVAAIEARHFRVESVEKKQVQRHPAPPFATSTLQQEASRKLGFGADRTMRTAQRLFEGVNLDGETVGLITYMRTDSVQLSGEALAACRSQIAKVYGDRYLPEKPRVLPHQDQERPGGARGDPADRPRAHAPGGRALSRRRSASPVRADLEAHAWPARWPAPCSTAWSRTSRPPTGRSGSARPAPRSLSTAS